jgi:hypothetical protein
MVTELVSALERELAYADARAVLEAPPGADRARLLVRLPHGVERDHERRRGGGRGARAAPDPDRARPSRHDSRACAACWRGPRWCAQAVAWAPRDLRGWHYVTTGGLLLERSPYGLDQPMHGRYAYLNDAPALVAPRPRRPGRCAGALGPGPAVRVRRARSRPRRESPPPPPARASGFAVAPWPTVGVPAPGLVVAGDLGRGRAPRPGRCLRRARARPVFLRAPRAVDPGRPGRPRRGRPPVSARDPARRRRRRAADRRARRLRPRRAHRRRDPGGRDRATGSRHPRAVVGRWAGAVGALSLSWRDQPPNHAASAQAAGLPRGV